MELSLTTRQQQVLRATVDHYVATAEPVGSKALAREYSLSISPATIRNVMGVLEQAGLLFQPHTSAGRVPSDFGYRHYVDELMMPSATFVQQIEQALHQKLRTESWILEVLLRDAAQILATLSGCVALITLPQATTSTVRHLHLVQVAPHRVMLILVTDAYETQSVVMELPRTDWDTTEPDNIEQELKILSNFLNHHFVGSSLQDLVALDQYELDREFQKYTDFLKILLSDLMQRCETLSPNNILVGGLAEVLRQPEFSELQQAQTLIHLLEDGQDLLRPLIDEIATDLNQKTTLTSQHQKVNIRIGTENSLESIRAYTLISSTYQKGHTPVGSVGILGPTRMAYEKIIALVTVTADYLSTCLTQTA
ncbi:heat-inducible transcriptional repressor HrcA [Acaryochloris sp. IP29b_bin.137]|uniref:heat-inducible transcriptional repressor HrcA n=1 Tax=Acaryochloris sp. IP29b_bin.137 TaxID=2969217 RepID=UPI00260BBE7B|nr:heat-inducible transcriptional repressor HrcA [Acaryochloris sp. IP29b_bin.137]